MYNSTFESLKDKFIRHNLRLYEIKTYSREPKHVIFLA